MDAGGSDDAAGTASSASAMATPEVATEDSAGSSGSGSSAAEKSVPQPTSAAPLATQESRDRAVLRNAAITLSAPSDEVEDVVDRAIRLVDSLGGYVQTSEVSSSGSRANATLVVKIPTARLDNGLAQISKLAHVKSRSQQAQDVTDQRCVARGRRA